MGFINDKLETVNSVALFEVLNNLPKGRSTSSLNSVTSKSKNLLPFLIDLLSITCKDSTKNPKERNRCEATRILIEILVEFYPVLMKIFKEGLVKAIKAGLACGTDFTLPTFTVKFKLKIKNLDFNQILKVDPNSEIGSTFYGKNATTDLNWFLNNIIQNGGSGTWKNIMDFNYNQTNEELEVGINPTYSGGGKTFDGFLIDFINSIELFTLEQFMARLTDTLTGTLMAGIGTSLDQVLSMEKISKLQDKINNTDPFKEDYQIDDSYFQFSNDEMLEMEIIAKQKVNGVVNLDLGCGIVESTISPTAFKGIFDGIRNTPPSKVNQVIEFSVGTLNDSLTTNVSDEDKNIAKLSLNARLIEEIPKVLTNTALEPKLVLLYQMCSVLVNGPMSSTTPAIGLGGNNIDANIKVSNSFDYTKVTSVFFEFIVRESLAALLEIIFKQVKEEILKLVASLVVKIAKEQVKLKIKTLTFLTGGLIEGLLASVPTPDISKYA